MPFPISIHCDQALIVAVSQRTFKSAFMLLPDIPITIRSLAYVPPNVLPLAFVKEQYAILPESVSSYIVVHRLDTSNREYIMALFDEEKMGKQTWQSRVEQGRLDLSASVEAALADNSSQETLWLDEDEQSSLTNSSQGSSFIPPRLSLQSKPLTAVYPG